MTKPNPSHRLVSAIAAGFAPVIREFVAKSIEPLLARIKELETSAANFKYVGVFKQGQACAAGNFATHDGSVWHANTDTVEVPGKGSDWQLAVKRGRSDRR
jgi:hypothetical protein